MTGADGDQPSPRRGGRRLPHDPRHAVKRTQRRGGRRRKASRNLVVISWRDIPAQVNGGTGSCRVQRILPRRFQRAIDRAAMVADKTQASQYVAEWHRVLIPGDPGDPESAALAAAADLEEAFPIERLNRFVKTGGWDPDRKRPSDVGESRAAGSDTDTSRAADAVVSGRSVADSAIAEQAAVVTPTQKDQT